MLVENEMDSIKTFDIERDMIFQQKTDILVYHGDGFREHDM